MRLRRPIVAPTVTSNALPPSEGELVDAHSQHSYRKHWAQTVPGRLACRSGDLDRAVSHLRESANVRPEYRLSSYGPSLDLVREVCARGRWDEGLKYLRVWEDVWDDPRLREWIAAVEDRRLPSSEGLPNAALRIRQPSVSASNRPNQPEIGFQLALFWSAKSSLDSPTYQVAAKSPVTTPIDTVEWVLSVDY